MLTATGTPRPRSRHAAAWAQRLRDDRVGHRAHEPGLLREVEEVAGDQQSARRVVPAHQRLHPHDVLVGEADLGLVVQDELVLVDPTPQLRHQLEPRDGVEVAAALVDLDPVLGVLGRVHRHVRAPQQVGQRLAVLRVPGDPDAGGHVDHHGRQLEGDPQAVAQAPGDLDREHLVGVREPDGELVAAEASHHVVLADLLAQSCRDLHQQLVAGLVAQRVVDLLEAVEVEQQQGADAIGVGVGQRLGDLPRQALAVGQSGQHVVQRLLLLANRHRGGLLHGQQRREQEEDEDQLDLRQHDQQGGHGQHGRGRHRVVDDVVEQLVAEPPTTALADQRADEDEVGHVVRGGRHHQRGDVVRVHHPRRRRRRPEAADAHDDPRRRVGHRVLRHVEDGVHGGLVLGDLAGQRPGRQDEQGGPQPPPQQRREHERGRQVHPLRVVPAGGDDGPQVPEDHQAREQAEPEPRLTERDPGRHLGRDDDRRHHDRRPPHRGDSGRRRRRAGTTGPVRCWNPSPRHSCRPPLAPSVPDAEG